MACAFIGDLAQFIVSEEKAEADPDFKVSADRACSVLQNMTIDQAQRFKNDG